MPTILTVDEVRDHFESDLVDDALERLIEDADQEIIDRLGVLATHTEVLDGEGLPLLVLSRRASAISSATERVLDTDYALAATDYELVPDGYRIQRKQGANYPLTTWRGRVTVVYVPIGGVEGELAGRKRLLVDLVKLAEAYTARASQSLGDGNSTALNYQQERVALFAPFLRRNRRLPLA